MKKGTLAGVLLAVLLMVMGGCAMMGTVRHEYFMRGQILDVNNNIAYLCIGSSDGASVGQELTVHRFEKIPGTSRAKSSFKKVETGKIKIIEIVDEHYAKAEVVTGEVKVNYTAELKR